MGVGYGFREWLNGVLAWTQFGAQMRPDDAHEVVEQRLTIKRMEQREKIVAKALDGQRYPLPLCVC